MNDYAIEVKNLTVGYKILEAVSVKKSFFQMCFKKAKIFKAVKNVSFSLGKGEILGLVGGNGAGKSTLLKVVAGIFSPDEGSVDLHGNSISLLAVGLGFKNELSGRENIVITGMLMGFSERVINECMDSIIEFSGLGNFIDFPVKTYSSGMKSKLSFSIAVTLKPDILLVDEVLSVGDARFRKKSFSKMQEIIMDNNRTVIIVSHSSANIRKLCTKVLWLEKGEVRMFGDVEKVMDEYDDFMSK